MPTLPHTLRTTLLLVCVGLLLAGGFIVLKPFLTGIAWAIVIVLVTWPLYRQLSRRLPAALASILMVFSVALVAALIIGPTISSLITEIGSASKEIRDRIPEIRAQLEEASAQSPLLADVLINLKAQVVSPSLAELERALSVASHYQETVVNVLTFAIGGVVGALAQLIVTLFTLFFLYYHGIAIGEELRAFAHAVFGESSEKILQSMRETVRGAVYGVLVTAVAQGALAGIGFAVAGAPMPILFAVVTILFSLIPMGTPFVYIPIVLYVGLSGAWITALILLIWCVVIVSGVDNVIRPIFISQATNASMALVFFGVLGGVMSFGLIGIFLGPVILVILQLLLRELTRIHSAQSPPYQ